MCDLHRIRESTPPSRCDWCEVEFRDLVDSGRQVAVTAAFAAGPIAVGAALMAIGYAAVGVVAFLLGPAVGIAVRVYQRRHGAMRRRFLAERAELLPAARVVERARSD
jgi:hypothetical protein